MSKYALQIICKIEKAYDRRELSLSEVAVLRAIAMAARDKSLIASETTSRLAKRARMDAKTFRKYRNKLTAKGLLCVTRQPRGGVFGSRADHHAICWQDCRNGNETLAPVNPQGKSGPNHQGIQDISLGNVSPFNTESSIYTLNKQKKGEFMSGMPIQTLRKGRQGRRGIPNGLSDDDIEWLQFALPGKELAEIIIWLWELEKRVGSVALCRGLNRAKKPIETGDVHLVMPYIEKAAFNELQERRDHQPIEKKGYSVQLP